MHGQDDSKTIQGLSKKLLTATRSLKNSLVIYKKYEYLIVINVIILWAIGYAGQDAGLVRGVLNDLQLVGLLHVVPVESHGHGGSFRCALKYGYK